jgi:hypothetical protein
MKLHESFLQLTYIKRAEPNVPRQFALVMNNSQETRDTIILQY